ncbi:hypothetical protein BHM03_00028213 [Ensete ventricosum]|nr:hypothetical protein BHM03_00028213 [Ensete ventricosum]
MIPRHSILIHRTPLVHRCGDGRSLIIVNHVSEAALKARTIVACIGADHEECQLLLSLLTTDLLLRILRSIIVLEALDVLRKKSDAQAEEIVTIEKLVADAYSAIDKAVQVGTLHRNTGARRKSRLARRKKAVEIHHGWYIPAAAGAAA